MKCLSEELEKIDQIEDFKERVAALQKEYCFALKQVIEYCFLPEIKWILPEGEVPYTPNTSPHYKSLLYTDARRLYLFVEGGNPNLTDLKRERLFIDFVEALDAKDAELICSIKDKKWPYKKITRRVIHTAFEGMIP